MVRAPPEIASLAAEVICTAYRAVRWTREKIVAAMNPNRSTRVNLARPIQVILFYVTAVVMPEDGTIRFAEDIYGQDAKLDRALTRWQSDN
jgi:murein L,D-transpeptidase YcbB/YkuD